MSLELYQYLTIYGSCYKTQHKLHNHKKFIEWTEENFSYVRYNPRKAIDRWGLSITSLNGELDGIPDLDSLFEYNKESNTNYTEKDFVEPTALLENNDLNNLLDPLKGFIFRSHIIKLNPGGYFPPHRDFQGTQIDSFRLLVPLKNMNPPDCNFIIDGNIQYWNEGSVYFVDTAKMHYVFNSSFDTTYMIVLNVDLNEKTVKYVTENMSHR